MSDVDTGVEADDGTDTTTDDGQTDAQAKRTLSPEDYERRLQAAGRDLREGRAERREMRDQIARLEAMIAGRTAPTNTARQMADEPDIDADPIAWMKYGKAELDALKKERAEQDAVSQQQQAQQAQVAQIATRMNDYEKDFRSDNPDYDDAVKHFRKVRTEELKEEGISDAEVNGAMVNDFVTIVARAIRAGKDPADVVYKLAKKRGFGGVDSDAKKLQTIAKAQQAGKSLSQGSGRQGDASELTYEYVNSLTGAAFTEARKKLKAQEKRRA